MDQLNQAAVEEEDEEYMVEGRTASAYNEMQEDSYAEKIGLAPEVIVDRFQDMLEKFKFLSLDRNTS
jgi:hypothetical protein